MEEKEMKTGADAGLSKGGGKRLPLAALVLVILCVCGWYYYRNTPLQRQLRILETADALLEAQEYEEAAEEYTGALEIEAPGPEGEAAADRARQGRLQALTLQADSFASQPDLAGRAQACDLYGQVLALCDEMEEETDLRGETADKLTRLQEEMASAFDSVACTTARDDRSGTTVLPGGLEVPYVWYYDLVQVTEEYYPYADRINAVLLQDCNAFFAGGMEPAESIREFRDMTPLADAVRPVIDGRTSAEAEYAEEEPADTDQSAGEAPRGDSEEGEEGSAEKGSAEESPEEYRNYVGEAGVFSGNGLLSIRLAEVRIQGRTRSVLFRGRTFRLSDGGEVTLGELTQRTDTGLRRLVRRRTVSFLEEQGYRNISRSEIEDYVTNTDPEDYKFCIRDGGEICLVIDQEVPFFRHADQVLEIPLEVE